MPDLQLARGRCAACGRDAQLAPQTVVRPVPGVRWVCWDVRHCLWRRGMR